jgi:hypothetical protein
LSSRSTNINNRNPWGNAKKGIWEGAWSDGSKEWTTEVQEELGHTFGSDSVFWISYEDLLRKYQHFDRTRLFRDPDWRCSQRWMGVDVPWKPQFNEKLHIKLTRESPLVLVLSQLDNRYFKGLHGQYLFRLHFRLHERNSPGAEDYIVRSHGNYLMDRSVSIELPCMLPGNYSVFISVVGERDTAVSSIEDVVKRECKGRIENEKLAAVGRAYDLAHSKATAHLEAVAALRKKADQKKASGARTKERHRLWEKRHTTREINKKQGRKNNAKVDAKKAAKEEKAKQAAEAEAAKLAAEEAKKKEEEKKLEEEKKKEEALKPQDKAVQTDGGKKEDPKVAEDETPKDSKSDSKDDESKGVEDKSTKAATPDDGNDDSKQADADSKGEDVKVANEDDDETPDSTPIPTPTVSPAVEKTEEEATGEKTKAEEKDAEASEEKKAEPSDDKAKAEEKKDAEPSDDKAKTEEKKEETSGDKAKAEDKSGEKAEDKASGDSVSAGSSETSGSPKDTPKSEDSTPANDEQDNEKDKVPVPPVDASKVSGAPPAAPASTSTATSSKPAAEKPKVYVTSDGESSASPIEDWEDLYSSDNMTRKPRPPPATPPPGTVLQSKYADETDDEKAPDAWNAICVVGFRVYSKDEDLELSIVMEGGSLEEGGMGEKGEVDLDNAQSNAAGQRGPKEVVIEDTNQDEGGYEGDSEVEEKPKQGKD